jgi:hypothetical protein
MSERDVVFEVDDFSYFFVGPHARNPDKRKRLTEKLVAFTTQLCDASQIREAMRRYIDVSTEDDFINPGLFRPKADNFWITIGPKERRSRCHVTVRVSDAGIDLELFAPHKDFTSALIDKVETRPVDFLQSISRIGMDDPYHFRHREAHYFDPSSSFKGQRIIRRIDYLLLHPSILTRKNFKELIVQPIRDRMHLEQLRPELFLVRHFSLSDLVANRKAVEHLAAAVDPMLPYLEFALDLP